jgi:hypothetical protein
VNCVNSSAAGVHGARCGGAWGPPFCREKPAC